jgi:hypothetical protein
MATTTSTIIGLFESRPAAERAVDAMLREGYSRDHLSIVAADPRTNATDVPDLGPKEGVGSALDSGAGAAIGGIAGFIGGIVALAIPGIGPIIAAGPLAAGIMGAGIGAATGGVVGALKSSGVPENEAARYAEAIRRGRVLITAQVPDDRLDHAADILDDAGAIDVEEAEERIPASQRQTGSTPVRRSTPADIDAARLRPEESLVERQKDRERRVHVYPGITGGGTTPAV